MEVKNMFGNRSIFLTGSMFFQFLFKHVFLMANKDPLVPFPPSSPNFRKRRPGFSIRSRCFAVREVPQKPPVGFFRGSSIRLAFSVAKQTKQPRISIYIIY